MKHKSSSIKTWAEEDRPREKLRALGKEGLTNAELIAILLGSGSVDETALALSKRMLSSMDSLNEMSKKGIQYFKSFKGIGEAKAVTLVAALEIGRRRQAEVPTEKPIITASLDTFRIM